MEEANQKRKPISDEANIVVQMSQWGELVLPWLNHKELAITASTCKTLHKIALAITRNRCLDATRSFEPYPVPFHNADVHPPYSFFLYSASQFIVSGIYGISPIRQAWGNFLGSSPAENIVQGSSTECHCGGADGNWNGLESGIMVECGPGCRNHVTRRGVTFRLKVVWDERKGWGLVADQLIPRRVFICEYAGELLTTEEARRRQKVYDELSPTARFSSALLVVREHLPSGTACLRINIDATRIGNIARFINHSCDGGNLASVLVRTSCSLVPRLCFFSSREIQQGEELTFSYGEIRARPNCAPCFCGSSSCLGTLPSENT